MVPLKCLRVTRSFAMCCEADLREPGNLLAKQLFHLYFSFIAEDKRMCSRVLKSMSWALALAFVALLPVAVSAQAASSPAKAAPGDNPSRWDIFAGYSYLAPKGSVTNSPTTGSPTTASYDAVNVGGLFSLAYYFNRYIGVQGEFGEHEWGDEVVGSPTSEPRAMTTAS